MSRSMIAPAATSRRKTRLCSLPRLNRSHLGAAILYFLLQSHVSRFVHCFRASNQENRNVPVQELTESVMRLGSERERIVLGMFKVNFKNPVPGTNQG